MRPSVGVYSSPSFLDAKSTFNPTPRDYLAGCFFYPNGTIAINVVKSSIFDKMKTVDILPL